MHQLLCSRRIRCNLSGKRSSALDGVDQYQRYYAVNGGILGFSLFWESASMFEAHLERITRITALSLGTSLNQIPFDPPGPSAPSAPPPAPPDAYSSLPERPP